MRIFAIPAAFLLACCFYPVLPKAAKAFELALSALYRLTLRLFTRKNGAADHQPALAMYLLALCGVSMLLSAIHPLAGIILMAPLFTGLAALPSCVQTEHELDSGAYVGDIPAYEKLVRETCASIVPAFIGSVFAPMLLCAVGMPLHMGVPAGYAFAALHTLAPEHTFAARIDEKILHAAEKILIFFMTLCCGVKGRNPLNVRGKTAEDRLLSIVGIAEDATATHAPMAGDIAQAVFLCLFSTAIFCFTLCAVGFVFCR